MTNETLFTEFLESLDSFDQKLMLVLKELMERQESLTIQTSRFALCRLLRLQYNQENVRMLDAAFDRLQMHAFRLAGTEAGFAVVTRAIADIFQDSGSEKLCITLGNIFLL